MVKRDLFQVYWNNIEGIQHMHIADFLLLNDY